MKISVDRAEATEDSMRKGVTETALQAAVTDIAVTENRQYEDNELLCDSKRGTGSWALADVLGQWPGKHWVI